MQNTNATYKAILQSLDHRYEVKVKIDGVEYGEDKIYSTVIRRRLFKDDNPQIGCAVSSEIDVVIDAPGVEISRMAKIIPYYRAKGASQTSPWYPKGVYFINSRSLDEETGKLTIHGCDAMRKAEQTYPSSTLTWSQSSPNAKAVCTEICGHLGVSLDSATSTMMTNNPLIVGFPAQYTMREVLESIATMYCGCFIMSDAIDGNEKPYLKLVAFADIPPETFYLVNEYGDYIIVGGYKILIGQVG